ncbi:hypothetical protein [Inquilinus sp.]|jgi:hypothetical protein|uniref:hypothetical protein n=1 Tax=Inquilinus sp. TaxID=1932117 RepID=UPI003784663B
MNRVLPALLLMAGCGETIVDRPVMAPVDTPRLPRGTDIPCADIEWPAIALPTTAAEQAAGRLRDRAIADGALEECDGRRARAVRAFRRGATK